MEKLRARAVADLRSEVIHLEPVGDCRASDTWGTRYRGQGAEVSSSLPCNDATPGQFRWSCRPERRPASHCAESWIPPGRHRPHLEERCTGTSGGYNRPEAWCRRESLSSVHGSRGGGRRRG